MTGAGVRNFHSSESNLTNDKYRLLYTLSCQGEFDWLRHARSLPVCQEAYERHEVILEGVIGRCRAPAAPRVSLKNDHGDNGAHGGCATKARDMDVLELRGHLTEWVLVLARDRND
jgi:hypothetical protein